MPGKRLRGRPPFVKSAMTVINQVDLPMPPSVNALWRTAKGRIYRSLPYRRWMTAADAHCIMHKTLSRIKVIAGPFDALIMFDRTRARAHRDLDNRAKAVLDWAATRELIANDKHCQALTMVWTPREDAPDGCRLILTERAP